MTAIKDEIKKQGYTPVLNWWIDDLMPLIPNDEWRLLNRINRLIVGMDSMRIMQGKGSISHKDLLGNTTGVNRPNNIVAALKNLVDWNVLTIVEKSKGGRGHRGTKYEITFDASLINWAKIEADYQARMLKSSHKFSKETANSTVSSSTNKPLTVPLVVPEITANSTVKNKMAIYGFAMAQMPFFKEKAIYILINMHEIEDLMKEKIFNLKPELNLKLTDELINLIKEKKFNENRADTEIELVAQEQVCIEEDHDLSCTQAENKTIDIEGLNSRAVAGHSLSLMPASQALSGEQPMTESEQMQSSFIQENTVLRTDSAAVVDHDHAKAEETLKESGVAVNKKARKNKHMNSAAAENLAQSAVTDSKPRKPRKTSKYTQEQNEWRKLAYNAICEERGGAYIGTVATNKVFGQIGVSLIPVMEQMTIADIHNVYRLMKFTDKNGFYDHKEITPSELEKRWQTYVLNNRVLPKGVERWVDPSEKPAEFEKPKRQAVSKYERYIE